MNDIDDGQSPGVCSRCETLPNPLPAKGTLYIAPPIIHTTRRICSFFEELDMPYTEMYRGIFATRFTRDQLDSICAECFEKVSTLELEDTKCLVLAEGEELTIHHLTRMQPLKAVVARIRGEWLFGVLRQDRIRSLFQPIVSASDPAEVFAYECLARGYDENGQLIHPGDMFRIAIDADLLFNLDRACRLAAISGCVEHALDRNIFVNFNPSTIYQPEFCLQTTMKAVDEAGLDPANLVFEVVESEEVRDVDHLLKILNYYRDHGFRVALDDLGAGYASLNLLTRLRPDFVKLDMDLIRNVDTDPYKGVITENLLNMAKGLGVQTIAEGVETVGEWRWLARRNADYLQGFLFARPGAPPEPVTLPE